MILFSDIDLLTVGLAVVAIGILGFIVFLNNRKSITNLTFLIFTFTAVVYSIFNYASYQVNDSGIALQLIRLVIFAATWYAYFLFQLLYVFPKEHITFSRKYLYLLLPSVLSISVLNLTPFVFSGLKSNPVPGKVAQVIPGPGAPLFILMTTFLVVAGIYLLIKKTYRAGGLEKTQLRFVLIGTSITYVLIIIFNMVLPLAFENVRFVPLAPLFTLPFLVFTSYAIIKHHLFNVRVIATQLFTFALWLTLLVITVNARTLQDIIIHAAVFVATVVLGIFLIRSVQQEVRTRERVAQLALDLEITNKELKQLDEAKSDFISIASHQLRTPLSIIKGYMSMLREGTYGKIDKKLEDPIHKVYVSNERLINLVSDLLDLSRMERGKMQYEFLPIRLGEVAEGIVQDFEKVAKDKGLEFSWKKGATNDLVKGDAGKLRQVVLNLIDNAIKYTSAGSIATEIQNISGNRLRFSVTDTGPGLTAEEAHILFQKFSRGQEESKSHTEGLGLGLYVAKLIAQAHGGELAVTSPGKGKGSVFSLTLPVYSETTEEFKKFASEI